MAYSDENSTMSLPLLNLKDLLSGKMVADASDYLYSIVDQEADQFLVAAYNEEVAKLDVLMSMEAGEKAAKADHMAYDFLYDQDSLLEYPFLGLIRLNLYSCVSSLLIKFIFLQSLPLMDLITLLEICWRIHERLSSLRLLLCS